MKLGYLETESIEQQQSQGHSKSKLRTNPVLEQKTTRKQRNEVVLQKKEVRACVQLIRKRLMEKDTEIHRRQRRETYTQGRDKDKEAETERREQKERKKDGHIHGERDCLTWS